MRPGLSSCDRCRSLNLYDSDEEYNRYLDLLYTLRGIGFGGISSKVTFISNVIYCTRKKPFFLCADGGRILVHYECVSNEY